MSSVGSVVPAVGGANVAVVGPVGFIATLVPELGGGVMAEKDGESVGSVNPFVVDDGATVPAAVVPIGGGVNAPPLVEGAETGVSTDAIDELLDRAYDVPDWLAGSDFGVKALAPNA